MKKLITIFAGVVLAASLTTAAYAQAAGPARGGVQTGGQAGGQKPGQKDHKARGPIGGKLLKQLNLTPDQQKQVKEMVTKFQEKRQATQKAGTKPDRKEAMAMRKEFMEQLAKILTPEQKEKLKQLQEKGKDKLGGAGAAKGKGKGKGGVGGTGTATTGGGGGL